MRSRVAGVVLAAVLGGGAGVVGAGCGAPADEEVSRDAQVYIATIRDVLAEQPPPEEPDVLPVVYVLGVGERKIPADVQAEVLAELDADAEVQFADERSEVPLEDADDAPVRDDGVLIVVGELPEDVEPVEVEVEVYRSEADWSKVVLTVARRSSSHWTVTSASVLPDEPS